MGGKWMTEWPILCGSVFNGQLFILGLEKWPPRKAQQNGWVSERLFARYRTLSTFHPKIEKREYWMTIRSGDPVLYLGCLSPLCATLLKGQLCTMSTSHSGIVDLTAGVDSTWMTRLSSFIPQFIATPPFAVKYTLPSPFYLNRTKRKENCHLTISSHSLTFDQFNHLYLDIAFLSRVSIG